MQAISSPVDLSYQQWTIRKLSCVIQLPGAAGSMESMLGQQQDFCWGTKGKSDLRTLLQCQLSVSLYLLMCRSQAKNFWKAAYDA